MINAPDGLPARPTTDYAKSGLFNVLANEVDFEGLQVLDLFAGIGGISMEFLSREAKWVTAVDVNFKCINFIKDTAAKFKVNNVSCVRFDVFKYLKQCDKKFDLIFADPPFDLEEADLISSIVFEKNLLNPGGVLIVEHYSKRVLPFHPNFVSVRTYGNCAFSFYRLSQ